MGDRTCPRCGKWFQYPSGLKRHLARTTQCTPNHERGLAAAMPPLPDKDKPFRCDHCRRDYTTPQSLSRHRKSCDARPPPAAGSGAAPARSREPFADVAAQPVDFRAIIREELADAAGWAAPSAKGSRGQASHPHPVVTNVQHNTLNTGTHVHFHASPVSINYWGEEDLTFLNQDLVKHLLKEALRRCPDDAASAAQWLFSEALQRSISDPSRPENLTAYMLRSPRSGEGVPIIHSPAGWNPQAKTEMMYMSLVSRVLDKIFINQPFDEDHEKYGPLMFYLRDHERDLTKGQVVPALLELNRDRLLNLLGVAPPPGAPPNRLVGVSEVVPALDREAENAPAPAVESGI